MFDPCITHQYKSLLNSVQEAFLFLLSSFCSSGGLLVDLSTRLITNGYGSRMRIITFVRHGQSMANVGGVTTEHHAIALTDAGRAQALALVDLLPRQPSGVLVSPFERAQDTCQPYCSKLGIEPQIVHSLHEFETIDPDLMQGMTGAERAPLVDAYWKESDVNKRMGPRAESFAEFVQRVESFRTTALPQLEDGTVIFGHGMWIALLCWLELGFTTGDGYAMQSFRRFQLGWPMPNGAVYRLVELQAGRWRLEADEASMRRMLEIAQMPSAFE